MKKCRTGKQIKIVKEEEDIMKAEEKVDTDLGADLLKPRDEDDEDLQKLRQVAHFARDLRYVRFLLSNKSLFQNSCFVFNYFSGAQQRTKIGIENLEQGFH